MFCNVVKFLHTHLYKHIQQNYFLHHQNHLDSHIYYHHTHKRYFRNFLDFYNIIQKRVEHINTDYLVEQYKKYPLKTVGDNRHILKLSQWDKFYVFDDWFKQWNKVIFFDAGLRVFDKISILNDIDCTGKIMAPDDIPPYENKGFRLMMELDANPEATEKLFKEYPKDILDGRYFLNCIWVYDTALLNKCNMTEMIDAMNKYPICRCNEMTIMNLLFTFKLGVWKPFPEFAENGKFFNLRMRYGADTPKLVTMLFDSTFAINSVIPVSNGEFTALAKPE